MRRGKSSISQAASYQAIGEFWDTHDTTEYWEQSRPVEFEMDIQSEVTYYAVEQTLAARLSKFAKQRGVLAGTLLNLWLQEKLQAEPAVQTA